MKKYVFGVDVGGTTIKMGLFDKNGNLLEKWEIPSVTANGGERVLPDIAESIRKVMQKLSIEQDEVAGVGIGVPGPVDAEGTVYKTANLGWDMVFNIPEAFRENLDVPVMAGNDANVAALGEMWQVAVLAVTAVLWKVQTVPAVRLDTFMWRIRRPRNAAAIISAVWSSMHPQPVLQDLPTGDWKKMQNQAFCAIKSFLPRQSSMP